MVQLSKELDTATTEDTSFAPLPAGQYKMQIINSEGKLTRAGDGEYVVFTFEVIDGEFAGRKVFFNVNTKNPNPDAVKFGMSHLAKMARAAFGKEVRIHDTELLHHKAMLCDVFVQPARGNFAANNSIRGFNAIGKAANGGPNLLQGYKGGERRPAYDDDEIPF